MLLANPCFNGGVTRTSNDGIETTPGWTSSGDGQFPALSNCQWLITASPGNVCCN